MEGGALQTDEFVEFSKDVILFCHITSKVEEEKYPNLLREKGGRGFPTFVILDAKGDVVARHSGPRTAAGFAQTVKSTQSVRDLKKKADAGDPMAKGEYLIHLARLGQLSAAKAKEELASLELPAEFLAIVKFQVEFEVGLLEADDAWAQLADLKITKARKKELQDRINNQVVMESVRGASRDQDVLIEAGEKFWKMYKDGRVPNGRMEWPAFWRAVMSWAEDEVEPKAYEKALVELEAKYGQKESAKKWFKRFHETLERLKEQKDK